MKELFCLAICLLSLSNVRAQYTMQGKIEYEKKVNIHRTIDEMDEDERQWIEKFRSQVPKYNVTYFDLYFNTKTSIYKPGKETENPIKMWFSQSPAAGNVVYTDFTTRRVTALKEVYEQKFLVQDSMRKMTWKISDEIRTIANYKCRKAVGIICDSVYVVAFYTEDIMASGGPEMFSGLPGMILEVAIPRLFTTWIATSVEVELPANVDITAPAKGKKTNQAELHETVKDSFKRWGKFAERNVWWTLL